MSDKPSVEYWIWYMISSAVKLPMKTLIHVSQKVAIMNRTKRIAFWKMSMIISIIFIPFGYFYIGYLVGGVLGGVLFYSFWEQEKKQALRSYETVDEPTSTPIVAVQEHETYEEVVETREQVITTIKEQAVLPSQQQQQEKEESVQNEDTNQTVDTEQSVEPRIVLGGRMSEEELEFLDSLENEL